MTEQDSKRESVLKQIIALEITVGTGAELLQISWRQAMRLKKQYQEHGIKGILHKSRGKPSNRSLDQKTWDVALGIVKDIYSDFGPTLAQEKLKENHGISLSVEGLRTHMAIAGLWKPKTKKANENPHTWRPRKECYGQLEQYDGSYHNWFEGRLLDAAGVPITKNCLLAAIDDATGSITQAEFADNEGIQATFGFWESYLKTHGKPKNIYVDKFTTYKNNPKKNQVTEILEPTQFGRACDQLGITLITAHSPQAKGRIERLFGTLQDRLVKELRLQNISTITEANEFLRQTFIPWFNQKFGVRPTSKTNLHTKLTHTETDSLDTIFSVQDQRKVTNDYTISHAGIFYQINPHQKTLVRVHDKVTVCTKMDESKVILKNNALLEFTELAEKITRPKQKVLIPKSKAHTPKATHPWKKEFKLQQDRRQKIKV